jgi:hypothetical protein
MSDQKDRFGEKLRDREKAEEDRYFAKEDKKKLERLKENEAQPPVLGLCPKCGTRLEERDHLGVTVDVCSGCSGVWLDKGELEAIEQRDDEHWPSTWFRSILGEKS